MTDSQWELPGVLLMSSIVYFAVWHFLSQVLG